MLNSKKLFNVLPAIALALAGASGFVYADSPQDIIDARQEAQIWTTYELSPYLRANDLKVSVHNGKAVLSGKVDEDVNKDLAKQIALGVAGIKEVDNQISVNSDYVPKTTANNYGQVIDDVTVTAAVKSRLAWSKYIDGQTVNVETKAGRVTITGMIANSEAKESAGRLAMGTRGVISVSNQLMINNKSATRDTSQKISDSWITTKVKSTFLYSRNVSGSDIEVKTLDGVVTLKGKVDSGAERALAIELVQNLRGVKSVSATELTN
jgi:hyperosmotically inducible periplasmic protein